ncbi:MAG: NADPH-dependent glutamate synthase [Spirochaetales bacterium]|nr:NADPH-dependent glutamate synthase [Spirochaetales bacterium]
MSKSDELTARERMMIERQPMRLKKPDERIRDFFEVALGYDEEEAKKEAERCLNCKKPTCKEGCPVGVPIPEFIMAIRKGDLKEAARIIKSTNNLPAICGRVCPQETQCELTCILGKKKGSVAIGRLERYVADWELSQNNGAIKDTQKTGYRIAVVGSGPAGLTCAADCAKRGHTVVIFEALHVAGGVLVYGIPEFRLPKQIVRKEIEYIERLGVEIRTNYVIGKIYSLDELLKKEGFDAVFLGTGAGLPLFLRIPGENLNGVYSANEFLTRVNLMKGYLFPEWDTPVKIGRKIAVVGAGNVAMDAARCALRLGMIKSRRDNCPPPEVHIVYRRSKAEMPARAEEVENAYEEGVRFNFLVNPLEILGNDKGWVTGMRCIRMELGEPDASGRRRPVAIEGSEFAIDVDTVIVALGTRPNPIVFSNSDEPVRTKWGTVEADEETGKTSRDRVWAGGDIVTGAATVISAMGAGKRAAREIHTAFIEKQ